MKCLVIGYGSIGKRHTEILKKLGCHVYLVTAQSIHEYDCSNSIKNAFQKSYFDYVIIANETHLHHDTLLQLIQFDFAGVVLIEKPIFSKFNTIPAHKIKKIMVGYNLRFCEPLITAKKLIEDENLISFSVNVGQYLPAWRQQDYRTSYSSQKNLGGGVLRDLSHELDYSLWFCGASKDVTAIGGQYSDLEINSDDVYTILMRCQKCPIVNIQMNYLDRMTRRDIIIHTNKHSIHIDLVKGSFNVDGNMQSFDKNFMSDTYLKQHQAILSNDFSQFCSEEEGLKIVQLIEKIEQSNDSHQWVTA